MKHQPQKIEIKSREDGTPVSAVKVFVDGKKIQDIRSMKFEVDVNKMPHLILDLNVFDISISAECLLFQKGVGAINIGLPEEPYEDGK